ncbi:MULTISPECIES: oxygen-independent coproporphyrinogen III oxidase [Chryseobacterium]|jgi:oxygen-independent coproporphyrinogen-3 oxidase|uniref:Coproporphyrinogen-III oxidase n=1 Tax=Chryseobacterium gambrini TaxID=373672 RepID=A0A1N7PF10_9FLAO|nr:MULTISPECIES: oxygen-independent coproporphyrinogen III oxidase [Chryseobacterium]HAO08498.1 oxygen-independent coproporphyrinogen III oxidase [Chryseobacterium sp.]MBL7878465.1 oxygen-independent coproporphyrinogen III oxidase [Chryseobacterium gambrini]MDN4013035.1 oxygen-independent coproporphyrinogen III oxidase [Chryseobacterium gambrini]MDN4030688.1 oxygen-independent coproporphyrinogen III oxidase [Chryseobacterium gambrini]QWA38704.1 oxygen-independent coproporphyrinogen III oxidase
MNSLIDKYNIPGPRYTSYPTVPYWDENSFTPELWKQSVIRTFKESNAEEGISIYIHLPFCEALCTFCACHKRITKQHSVEIPYLESVLKEWQLYLKLFNEKPKLKELHLGGGTPTFFSPKNLKTLLEGIFETVEIAEHQEFSFEGHPNNTTKEHLQTLYDLGFRRVSFGVQDYDPKVQKAINRIQSFEKVREVTEWAKEIGYRGISHDLVFGLPHQTWEAMESTIRKTMELKPDRLAFYSYAHVPWVKGVGQRGFDENDLPSGEEKRRLYEDGKKLLEELGYIEVGMDHFSLEHDDLYQSLIQKKLHRNFMGYTSSKTQLMVGLGMSAISDSWYAFAQNIKTVEEYQKMVEEGEIPVVKGHILNDEDLTVRRHILNLMCQLETTFDINNSFPELENAFEMLKEMENDELVEINGHHIQITEKGRAFTRNVAMVFDLRMMRNKPETRIFSMTI